MNQFLELPEEMIVIILSYVEIIDIVNLAMVNKHFTVAQDEYIHNTINKYNTLEYYPQEDYLFTTYFRGKSYTNSADYYMARKLEKGTDIPFTLSNEELILCHFKIDIFSHGPALVLVTMNGHYMYSVYEFRLEVDQDDEYTPDYWGWDGNDVGIYVLQDKDTFNCLNKIKISKNMYDLWDDKSQYKTGKVKYTESDKNAKRNLDNIVRRMIVKNKYDSFNYVTI